ncbi:MAG: carbohydrate ABC transporter permease [Spirochaetaceae bacterium]|jgi:multiple sugar transport system permease protein|nr:carbohydrate ABC transporter permease [Spirochaetaceae bacterium]
MSDIRNASNLHNFWERNRLSGGYLLKARTGEISYKICRALLLFGLCFLILQPLADKISVAFMKEADLYDATVISIPRHFTTDNFELVNRLIDYWGSLFQTLLIVISAAILQITSCTLAGYGFARFKFPLRNILFACVMLIIVVPPQTIMASLYLNFRFFDIFGLFKLITGANINMLSNVGAYLILCATAMGLKSGLYIFMLRQYFRGVPKELEEAALVDGCGRFRTFVQILLPDAMPMIVSCFLFSFVWQWTDTVYTSLFLSNFKMMAVGIGSLADKLRAYYILIYGAGNIPSQGYTQAINATGVLMCLVPLIVLYLVAQKSFVQSLSQTGIKM